MVERTAPPITLCVRGIGAPQQQPILRVVTVGLDRESALVGCLVEGATRSISGQIAVSLTLESVLHCVAMHCVAADSGGEAGQLIRESFREANKAVYDYAHRMRAGAAIGASLLLWGIQSGKMVVGRSGRGEVFLLRSGAVTPLFESVPASEANLAEGVLERFVGANAKVLVDLATTSIFEGDELCFLSGPPTTAGARTDYRELVSRVLCDAQSAADRLATILSGLGESHAGMIVGYGSHTIELRERIAVPVGGERSGSGEQ